MIFAQSIPEASLQGWVAAAGSGLLVPLLWWLLFKHLPAKDQQVKDFMAQKDQQLKDFIEGKDEAIKETSDRLASQHKANLDMVVAHCKEEMAATGRLFESQMTALTQSIKEMK